MSHLNQQTLLVLATVIFSAAVLLHLTKKNTSAVRLYLVQSSAIAVLLISSLFDRLSPLLILAIVATVAVKIVVAPYFFYGLIRKHELKFSVSTYLNTPVTLAMIAGILALTQSDFFTPLAVLASSGEKMLRLAFATILISLFLSINRRGALSQVLGILSLENGIVAFALFAGLEQSPGFQLGITFNILIWVIIATAFASMIFSKFGSLDVTTMKKLKD
jgi:hydrogenase-4 component E